MYEYKKNILIIDNQQYAFMFGIRQVISYKGLFYVLLDIPPNSNEINNIFCIEKNVGIRWRSEDLNILFPNLKNLPFEQMRLYKDKLYAYDFWGRNYEIQLSDGKIIRCILTK